MVEHAADVVELFADIDAATGQLGVRRLDVGHDKIKSLCRARDSRRGSLAEDDRARRAGRRKLYDPELVTPDEVGVEPPTQAAVESLDAISVRNRDDDNFELHVSRSRRLGCRWHGLVLEPAKGRRTVRHVTGSNG
jgi:hypothetical protein